MLFLCGEFPLPIASGSQVREMNLLRHFAAHFDVTLVTVAVEPNYAQHLAELERQVHRVVAVRPANKRSRLHRLAYKGAFWVRRLLLADSADRFYNTLPNVNAAIQAELARTRFDVIFAMYWYWDMRIWDAPGLKVLDANDVQSMRVEQLLRRSRNPIDRLQRARLLRRYRAMEADALRRADVIVAITEHDHGVFERITDGRAEQIMVPTGLDTDRFAPQPVDAEPKTIGFYGALRNPMNQDAVQFLIDEILPRIRQRHPDARLRVVGSSPSADMLAHAARDPGITFTGYLPDVRAALAGTAVSVLPLRIGWGIRGRVFELMALGVPVVATPIAVEGMGLPPGEGIVIAETPDEIAVAVDRILSDPALRADLGRRGREYAVAHVSLAATYGRLSDFLGARCGQQLPASLRGA
jgi:glycosyltransferase involved in cell wall biosynthesis